MDKFASRCQAPARDHGLAKELGAKSMTLMNMCDRGDKDVPQVAEMLGVKL